MIDKKNFITAYFIDNERKNIEILLRNDDGASVYTHILEYDPEHPDCKELLEICSLDDLHENTWERKREEKKDFEDQVIRIAKKEGLIMDKHKLDTKFFPLLVKAIFEDEHPDHLFALKIGLFEVEKIKNAKNDNAKKRLRQSKTKIGALKAAFDIMGA
jgi:hypothetical protein